MEVTSDPRVGDVTLPLASMSDHDASNSDHDVSNAGHDDGPGRDVSDLCRDCPSPSSQLSIAHRDIPDVTYPRVFADVDVSP
eukprot:3093677-Rhodomonas_salina.1